MSKTAETGHVGFLIWYGGLVPTGLASLRMGRGGMTGLSHASPTVYYLLTEFSHYCPLWPSLPCCLPTRPKITYVEGEGDIGVGP